jgi:hypothetical protein
MNADAKPAIAYWHLWTDEQGSSHQTRCELTAFEKAAIQPEASPQWIGSQIKGDATIFGSVLPPGWLGEWHRNPKPQWIIPLSGRWFVESMDGQRVEMGAGELSFGEDQSAREADGKKGHLSGTIGDEPAVLMIVQLETAPTPSLPCRFR